jgi:hypothetical protein
MKMDEWIKLELERESNTQDEQENNSSSKLMIAAESPILVGKACELLIKDLSIRAWLHTKRKKRKTVQRNDILSAISNNEMFDFLIDVVMHRPPQTHVNSSVSPPGLPQPSINIAHEMAHEIPTISHSETATSLTDTRKTPDLQHFESLNHHPQQGNADNVSQHAHHLPLHIGIQQINNPNVYSANTNGTLHPSDALILLSPQHPQDSQHLLGAQEVHHINHQLSLDASISRSEMHLQSLQCPQQIQDTQENHQIFIPSHPTDHNQNEFLSTTLQPNDTLNIPSPRHFQDTIHAHESSENILHSSHESLHHHQQNGHVNSVNENSQEKPKSEHIVDHSIPLLRGFYHDPVKSISSSEQ